MQPDALAGFCLSLLFTNACLVLLCFPDHHVPQCQARDEASCDMPAAQRILHMCKLKPCGRLESCCFESSRDKPSAGAGRGGLRPWARLLQWCQDSQATVAGTCCFCSAAGSMAEHVGMVAGITWRNSDMSSFVVVQFGTSPAPRVPHASHCLPNSVHRHVPLSMDELSSCPNSLSSLLPTGAEKRSGLMR